MIVTTTSAPAVTVALSKDLLAVGSVGVGEVISPGEGSGSEVASLPTIISISPLTGVSLASESLRNPPKEWVPAALGAVTVYVKGGYRTLEDESDRLPDDPDLVVAEAAGNVAEPARQRFHHGPQASITSSRDRYHESTAGGHCILIERPHSTGSLLGGHNVQAK